MLAHMVTPGNRIVDVGCDHGFLSIYLIRSGTCPRALAMDVREGPLAAARAHTDESGLGAYIETRLSDGLKALGPGEADSAVIAGMGGPLMEKILRESLDKAGELKELILQPQSEIGEFRRFLDREGFVILDERAVREDGKYYFAMKAVFRQSPEEKDGCAAGFGLCHEDIRQSRIEEEFGPLLLRRRDPVLKSFLCFRRDILTKLQEKLAGEAAKRAAGRLEEIGRELEDIEYALGYFGS